MILMVTVNRTSETDDPTSIVILSEVRARFALSAIRAGARTQSKDLSSM